MIEKNINGSVIRLIKGDITDLEVEAFVYNARPDLQLGSGYGTAISLRGGPKIQEELKKTPPLSTGQAVISGAGNMKAKHIIHTVGPRFQEERLEEKLQTSIYNSLKLAEEKGIKQIALPALGAGFYGVPLDVCAKVTLETIKKYLEGKSKLKEIVICLLDNREFGPFKAKFETMN